MGQNRLALNLKRLGIISVPFLAFFIIFTIRMGFDFIGLLTIIGNPIIALFIEDLIPLINFIK